MYASMYIHIYIYTVILCYLSTLQFTLRPNSI